MQRGTLVQRLRGCFRLFFLFYSTKQLGWAFPVSSVGKKTVKEMGRAAGDQKGIDGVGGREEIGGRELWYPVVISAGGLPVPEF